MKCLGREHKDLERRGVTILGISADEPQSHARFAKALGLRFDLLSDSALSVARKYGVYAPSTGGGFAIRSVFLIDREGRLRYVDRDFGVPRGIAGTPLGDAIDALGATDEDPLAELAELPEPERAGKTVLGELLLAVIEEDVTRIDGLLHADFGARPGTPGAGTAKARKTFLDAWRRTFEAEEFDTARLSSVLDFDAVKVLTRDNASSKALRAFSSDVRLLAAGLRKDDVLVAVRCHGLSSDDGSKVLARTIALDLRKEGDAWRIAALTGR